MRENISWRTFLKYACVFLKCISLAFQSKFLHAFYKISVMDHFENSYVDITDFLITEFSVCKSPQNWFEKSEAVLQRCSVKLLCNSVFFNKAASATVFIKREILAQVWASNLIKKETLVQVFSSEFFETIKNAFVKEISLPISAKSVLY